MTGRLDTSCKCGWWGAALRRLRKAGLLFWEPHWMRLHFQEFKIRTRQCSRDVCSAFALLVGRIEVISGGDNDVAIEQTDRCITHPFSALSRKRRGLWL